MPEQPAAPDSWIDNFVSEVQQYTDAPTSLIRAVAYFTLSACIKKRVYYRTSRNMYPNVYMLSIGSPGRYHKTYVSELGIGIVRKVVNSRHFLPQGGSDIAFDEAVAESDGYGIAYYEEFAEYVNLLKSENNSQLESRFNRYFNPSVIEYRHRTKKDGIKEVPAGSVLGLLSSCTEDQFFKFLGSRVISSGLLSRCVLVHLTEKDLREQKTMAPRIPADFYSRHAQLIVRLLPKRSQEMKFSDTSMKAISEIQSEQIDWYEEEANQDIEEATARYPEITQRLSIVRAVSRGSTTVEDLDVNLAFNELVQPSIDAISTRFMKYTDRGRPDQMLRAKTAQMLAKKPMTTRMLAKRLNETTQNVLRALEELTVIGEVHHIKSGRTIIWQGCNGKCEGHKDLLAEDMAAINLYWQQIKKSYNIRMLKEEEVIAHGD